MDSPKPKRVTINLVVFVPLNLSAIWVKSVVIDHLFLTERAKQDLELINQDKRFKASTENRKERLVFVRTLGMVVWYKCYTIIKIK